MNRAPRPVRELAERRARARAERDHRTAEALRAQIETAGWAVSDVGDGFALTRKPPPYPVWPDVRSIPEPVTDLPPEPFTDAPPGPTGVTGLRPDSATSSESPTGPPPQSAVGLSSDPVPAPEVSPAEKTRTSGTQDGGAEARPAKGLGFAGDQPPDRSTAGDLLHAQRLWDDSIAVNRLDDAGITLTRRRTELADVTVSVALLADGCPDDLRACVESVLAQTTAHILLLDLGNLDGAGTVAHELAGRHGDRMTVWHVAETPHWRGGSAEWGACRAKLLALDEADVHVLMETSTLLTGDALTPLVGALRDGAVAAGWQGVEPPAGLAESPAGLSAESSTESSAEPPADLPADRREWREAGPGRVRALRGRLLAVRRRQARAVFPVQARYHQHADLELSLALPGDLVVPAEPLPVVRRQRPRPEVDPAYRERESRRTYDRVLRRLAARRTDQAP